MTRAGKLLDAAFKEARANYAELNEQWVRISVRIGSKLPASLLMPTIQRDGELDVLIRCMEDEFAALDARGREQDIFALHRVNMFSEYWIGAMYETFRLLRQRKLCDDTANFSTVLRELELVRIPLEKHEIAKDVTLRAPLALTRRPQTSANDEYVYASGDQMRAHIMPRGVSERGSIMWHVVDLKSEQCYWVERRRISDGILDLWKKS
jgi:hypothetical protein